MLGNVLLLFCPSEKLEGLNDLSQILTISLVLLRMFLQESLLTLLYYGAPEKFEVQHSSPHALNYMTEEELGIC